MDIVRFKSGLGNQMFQYAFLDALKNKGRVVKTCVGKFKTRLFLLCDVYPNIVLDFKSDHEFEVLDIYPESWIAL